MRRSSVSKKQRSEVCRNAGLSIKGFVEIMYPSHVVVLSKGIERQGCLFNGWKIKHSMPNVPDFEKGAFVVSICFIS